MRSLKQVAIHHLHVPTAAQSSKRISTRRDQVALARCRRTEVVIGFRLIKVPDEEFVGMANLKGGESHDFVVNSGSYDIFVIPGNGHCKFPANRRC